MADRPDDIDVAGPAVDPGTMRRLMRHVVSPVTVVTAGSGDRAMGITIGSFASTSLEPALISFNLSRGARMHEILPFEATFIVHVLGEDQAEVSERFAVPDVAGREQFAGVASRVHESGTRIIDGSVVVLLCRLESVFPAGDHSLIVGRVVDSIGGSGRQPLLYYNQSYRSVGETRNTDEAVARSDDGTP